MNLPRETKIIKHKIGLLNLADELGNINGTCSATPTSPGPLLAGIGVGGKITVIDGAILASFVVAQTGISGSKQVDFYTALMDYTKDNAEVNYQINTVIGTFAAGGGPLLLGAGTGGLII